MKGSLYLGVPPAHTGCPLLVSRMAVSGEVSDSSARKARSRIGAVLLYMARLVAPEAQESIWLAGGPLISHHQGSHLLSQGGNLLFKGFDQGCVWFLLSNGSFV